MPTYKLHYFDIRGLAEKVRMLFSYGGIDFEDIRYTKDTWKENKPSKAIVLFCQIGLNAVFYCFMTPV